MSAPRTVTVPTVEHGPIRLACPAWCLGHDQALQHRADIAHAGTEHWLTFEGETLLTAALSQDPYATNTEARRTGLYVEQTGYAATLDPAEVRQLAAALTLHAMHLRTLAEQLAAIRAREVGE